MTTHTPSRQATTPVEALIEAALERAAARMKGERRMKWGDDPGVGLSNRALTTLAIVGCVAFIAWGIGLWG